jgi:hypothetical protein
MKISKEYIFKKLQEGKIGYIKSINEIPLRNEPEYKRIIIKLEWFDNHNSKKVEKRIYEEGGYINYVYEMPNYWKMVQAR